MGHNLFGIFGKEKTKCYKFLKKSLHFFAKLIIRQNCNLNSVILIAKDINYKKLINVLIKNIG